MKSKLLNLAMGASLTAIMGLGVVGCSQSYHSNANAPQIMLHSDHSSVQVGETVWVHATTMNLSNSSVHWKVTPSTATLTPDDSRQDLYAKFTATQPGGYVVKAYSKTGNGQWVTDRTTITVIGTGNQ